MAIGDSVLAQTFREAMAQWDREKAAGVSIAGRVAHLTLTLRAAWPFTREWKYLCAACLDTGLEMHACPGDANCGRSKPHLPHEYGTPCWCSLGRAFRPKQKPVPEDFSEAGKVGGGFSKAGRR